MRINALKHHGGPVEVDFDDFVFGPDGRLDWHPDLTTHISGPQWENLYDAVAFANRAHGAVLNAHVTLLWGRLGVADDEEASRRLVALCAALRKWCEARGWPCCYIYAHERSRERGLHTHLLAAVPKAARAAFEDWARRYARERIARAPALDPAAVKVRHGDDGNVERQWMWFGYLTKGAWPATSLRDRGNPNLSHWLHDVMPRRPKYGGRVRCRKRVGVSRNIDREARARFGEGGFLSRFQLGATTKAELYTRAYLEEHRAEEVVRALRI